ncbi:hypothetical protein M422DRAFT_776980 [Sphaerobolus stellatus SS14]|nr:hypothetical protein M422DRAFT_776980 [Sphaerobolus stellatus SS14]
MDVFDNFGSLDGLIQVIYHSTACFILISRVEFSSWEIELGLVGGENRWWQGSWDKDDVYKFAGSKVTERALETFSAKLSQYIVSGELAISGWSDGDENDTLKLQINPTGRSPVAINLTKLPIAESAMKAMNILKGIALQAQSRGCRISGSAPVPPPPVTPASKKLKIKSSPSNEEMDKELQAAQDRIKKLENEVNLAKQASLLEKKEQPSRPAPPRPPPGASRANPTRQKRKIVQAEFEDE